MKKGWVGFFAVLFVSVLTGLSAGQANAYNTAITYDLNIANDQLVSTYSGITYDFDVNTPVFSGDGAVVQGTTGSYAAPYAVSNADSSKYLAVPSAASTGSVTINLGVLYSYLGIWWGSVDKYNTLSLYKGSALAATISGSTIISSNWGNQSSSDSNIYLNISEITGGFDSIRLTSDGRAFEVDNITVGNPVPIPAAAWLLGSGLVGLAGVRRRKASMLD
ncbi:MAG: hypothetical protein A4E72_01724 [Syntrophus sp. PtaU1.Bin208]|nr:MAG: hypothetical protein A4E72_01724 [Syntrophus sp. PtaU1.Bin208]